MGSLTVMYGIWRKPPLVWFLAFLVPERWPVGPVTFFSSTRYVNATVYKIANCKTIEVDIFTETRTPVANVCTQKSQSETLCSPLQGNRSPIPQSSNKTVSDYLCISVYTRYRLRTDQESCAQCLFARAAVPVDTKLYRADVTRRMPKCVGRDVIDKNILVAIHKQETILSSHL